MARPFAQHGIITAVASYRLTPQGAHYPDQPRDVEAAVKWLYRKVRSYGGDPDALYIGGHSAGAILSADVGVRADWLKEEGMPTDLIKGIAPISGPYDLRPGAYEERAGEADAYVNREELRAQASPLINITNPPPRAVVATGSVETKYLDSSRKFVEKLQEKGTSARLLVLDDMDHDDTALVLGEEQSRLFQAILQMIKNR